MINILLADDHVVFRNGIRSILENDTDIKIVGEANDGREAIQLAEELNPDIIIMDLTMDDINGIEATKTIKKDKPEAMVIALSMHLNRQIIVQALEAGVSGYVLKDSSRTDLSNAIKTVYSGQRFLSPEVSDVVFESLNS